jgi:hypothetical protein
MPGDFHQVSIWIFAEKEIGPIKSLAGTFHDVDTVFLQMFKGSGKIIHLQGCVAHGPGNGFIIHHQMKLGVGPHLVPVPRKVERGPEYGFQTHDLPIKMFALFQITDDDADMIVIFYLDHLEVLLIIIFTHIWGDANIFLYNCLPKIAMIQRIGPGGKKIILLITFRQWS